MMMLQGKAVTNLLRFRSFLSHLNTMFVIMPDWPFFGCILYNVFGEGLKAWSHRRTDMYRRENGLKYAEFDYPVTKFIASAAQSSRDRDVEPGS